MWKKVNILVTRLEDVVAITALGLMTVVIFLQVIFRFVIKSSLPWSEELARYLMIWGTMVGASIGVRERAHIGVELFVRLLPVKIRRWAELVAFLVCLGFYCFVGYSAWLVVGFLMSSRQVSPAMQIPIYWAYLAVLVGVFLMFIRTLQAIMAPREEERK